MYNATISYIQNATRSVVLVSQHISASYHLERPDCLPTVCNWFLGNKKVNKINRIMNININLRDHVRRQFFGSHC